MRSIRHIVLIIAVCAALSPRAEAQSLWYALRGGIGNDQAWGVDTDSAGNVYLANCETPAFGLWFNIVVYKFDAQGREVWHSAPYGGTFNEYAYALHARAPFLYVVGRADSSLAPASADMLLLVYDMRDGSLVRADTWHGGPGYEELDGIVIDDEALYLSGWTEGAGTLMDAALSRRTLDGRIVWSISWGTSGWDTANGEMVADDSLLYITGQYEGIGYALGGSAYCAAFRKRDGSCAWFRTWGGSGYDDGYSIARSPAGHLYVVGSTTSFGNAGQLLLLKYDSNGDLLWEKTWGGAGAEFARVVHCLGDTAVCVTGNTDSYGSGSSDGIVVRFDSSGRFRQFSPWGGAGADVFHGAAVRGSRMYIAGETENFGSMKRDGLLLLCDLDGLTFPEPLSSEILPERAMRRIALALSPNPAATTVVARVTLPASAALTVDFCDTFGRSMRRTRSADVLPEGTHELSFDVSDLPRGFYYCVARDEAGTAVRPLLLVR